MEKKPISLLFKIILISFSLITGGPKGAHADSFLGGTTKRETSHKNSVPGRRTTIIVSYAAIECGCPQWFETKFNKGKPMYGVDFFYLEPSKKGLINAENLWDGENLPLTLKIVGRFSKEKELPISYHTKGPPEKARIFWYDKITILSPHHIHHINK